VFSWTARGHAWHPNAWAFDAAAGGAYRLGGWLGVSLLRLVLLGAIIAAAWLASGRLTDSRWARALAVFLAGALLPPFSALRPQLASFGLLLVCLHLTRHTLTVARPLPALALLAATVALWADVHGVVVVGAAAVVAASAGYVAERVAIDRASVAAAARRAGLTALVAVAASCMSPYGWTVWTYAVHTRAASRNIQEWQHPSLHAADDVFLFAVIVLALLWGLLRRGQQPWRELLPALVLTALAADAVRNEPLALLAAVPLLAGALEGVGGAMPLWLSNRLPRALSPTVAFAGLVVTVLAFGWFVRDGAAGLDLTRLRPRAFPVRSAAALPSGCRLLNEYDQGGYLILARPDIPVSQDGRNDLYGAAFVDRQGQLLAGAGGTAALDRLGITCVLVKPGRGLIDQLQTSSQWIRVAADPRAQAWIRATSRQ
jgi:hypothetical protein